MRTYEVRDIAAYVIEEYNRRGAPINNFKLNKVLYYIQARYLVEYDIPAFRGVIEKWKLGPVVPEIYDDYKYNGPDNIEKPAPLFKKSEHGDPFLGVIQVAYPMILRDDWAVIDEVIVATIPMSNYDLIDATRKHTPWVEWHERGENLDFCRYFDNEIWRYFYYNRDELL